jgi:NAD(P)-dependent dehydrogenase (short-subunit alcohol dehydrogenase family)
VGELAARFGGPDVVVHLVGGWRGGTPISEIADEDVSAMLDQHVWTTLNLTRAAAPRLAERGWGRIIAVSSPIASAPAAGMSAYALGKAAQEALLMTLARELGGTGVSVNVLHVRKIDADRERERQRSAKNAHWSTPEEIWAAIRYLCSDEAAAISGARLPLDHGA